MTSGVTIAGEGVSFSMGFSVHFLCQNPERISSAPLCSFMVASGVFDTSGSGGTASGEKESLFCSFIPCIGIKNKYNA